MRKISGAVQLLNCAGDFLKIAGADRIRPKPQISGSTRMDGTPPVGGDEQSPRHTSTPKGRFVLRADSIRPYGLSREAGSVHLTAPHVFVDFSN